MSYFKRDYIEMFLGVIRKYMQVRGPLSQKDLAELAEVGVSTISRLLNQKTRELDPQLMGKVVAKLNIPLHEVIDFIEEDSGERFVKLVKYFKEESQALSQEQILDQNKNGSDSMEEALTSSWNTDKSGTKAHIFVGASKRRISLPLGEEDEEKKEYSSQDKESKGPFSIKEKLERLSPRQKAYLSEFLSLDFEGRDLVVDVGNSLFRYFKQKGMEF